MKRTFAILCFLLALAAPAAARDTEALPERYISNDERIIFDHPTGWVVDDNTPDMITIMSNPSILTSPNSTIPPSEALIIMLFGLDSSIFAAGSDSVVEGDPVSTLARFVKFLSPAGTFTDYSPPRELTVGGYAAAQAFGMFEGNDAFIVLVMYDDNKMAFIVAVTASGEMPKYAPKLTAIVESVNYSPD